MFITAASSSSSSNSSRSKSSSSRKVNMVIPSPKQPFSFLGQLAINSARHARQLCEPVWPSGKALGW